MSGDSSVSTLNLVDLAGSERLSSVTKDRIGAPAKGSIGEGALRGLRSRLDSFFPFRHTQVRSLSATHVGRVHLLSPRKTNLVSARENVRGFIGYSAYSARPVNRTDLI